MKRRTLLLAGALAGIAPGVRAAPRITNVRFGILAGTRSEGYRMATETTRLPRRLKDTGFRWGLTFDNPDGREIEWYEVVHLPSDAKQVSGTIQGGSKRHLRTRTLRADWTSVVDHFWFDEGDPLGPHTLDLYVNGTLVHQVRFEVVKA